MNEVNLDILNNVPLTEVMRGWGYVPKVQKAEADWYLCPWHEDHNPSLEVRKAPLKDADALSFKCWAGHCGSSGFGAIQLAARLMGFPSGRVNKEDLQTVLNELMRRCDVKLEEEDVDAKKHYDTLRTATVGWDEFKKSEPQYAEMVDGQAEFEPGAWTEESLKALGIKLEMATRRAKKSDLTESHKNGKEDTSEIKIGDCITEFDPDTGEALYKCSLGKDFYRGPKAETKTIAQWGELVEQTFNIHPISRFLKRQRIDKGGVVVIIVKATKNYPMFISRYPWGVKKYEPKSALGNMKWTWWQVTEDSDLEHKWYADSALTDVLCDDGTIPQQDERHPYKVIDGDEEKKKGKKYRFERVVLCSGPRDAIAVWSHSNAHVVWLHSEQAGFNKKDGNVRPDRWLRAFINKLQRVTVEGGLYVCYDEDATGLVSSQAIALNSPQVHWLRLPKELTQISAGKQGKHLKDVTDFVTRFPEVERLMPADLQHDDPVEWFDNVLFDTPSTKFWQWESCRKEKDGTERDRYKFDLRNTPVFLRARGMARKVVQGEDESFSRFFLLGNDKIYTECTPGAKGNNKLVSMARDLMAEWLRAHKEFNDEKGSLSRAIYSAKLEQATMESIEQVEIDEKSYGEDFDHFFFQNTAVLVTKDELRAVSYSSMRQWTNREAILKGNFTVLPRWWKVVVNPRYQEELIKHEEVLASLHTADERAQENMRWDSWSSLWKYRLVIDKPMEEMPLHFRFLYNTCRIFWEKEQTGAELTATEKQVQDMYFITMLHAIGSALVRQRSANRQQFIHITDNGTRREDLASGGTGKTAILELFGLVRRVLSIDGKSLEGSNIVLEQELGKVVPGIHNIVSIDELPAGFSPRKMYNLTLSVTSRGLYKGSVVLRGDDLPKFVVASNEQLDLSSESTSRRAYQVLVSDWYHPRSMDGARSAHTPANDFKKQYGIKEVARNLPQALLNEARNLLLGCVQLFFQFPDETLRPPRDSRALLRQALAASRDEQFTRWIAGYLSDVRHRGVPIAQRELGISLLDYCGITVGEKTLKSAYKRIRDNLDDYIRTSIYVVDPPVVLLTPTDRDKKFRRCAAWQHPVNPDGTIQTDSDGNRLPRELNKKQQPRVYYFYRKGCVPRHFYDEAHVGDRDYVQGAPEVDPDTITIDATTETDYE